MNLNEQDFIENPEEIAAWLDSMGVKDYTLRYDSNKQSTVVDVEGNVDFDKKLGDLPQLPVRFGVVKGWFDCDYNHLTTLEGSPKSVSKDFYCRGNRLTTLSGAPQSIGKNFHCNYNSDLRDIRDLPKEIGEDLYLPEHFDDLGIGEKDGDGYIDIPHESISTYLTAYNQVLEPQTPKPNVQLTKEVAQPTKGETMNIKIGKTYYRNFDNAPTKVLLIDFMREYRNSIVPMVLGITESECGTQFTTTCTHEEFKRLFSEVPVCTIKIGTLVAGYMHKGNINPVIGILLGVTTEVGTISYRVGTLSGPIHFGHIETLDDLTARLLAQYE